MIDLQQNFGHLLFSGYIEPPLQMISSKGIQSFEGGDFSERVSNQLCYVEAGYEADIKYQTLRLGWLYYITSNVKWVLYDAPVRNEKTQGNGFKKDTKDDVIMCWLPFRF